LSFRHIPTSSRHTILFLPYNQTHKHTHLRSVLFIPTTTPQSASSIAPKSDTESPTYTDMPALDETAKKEQQPESVVMAHLCLV